MGSEIIYLCICLSLCQIHCLAFVPVSLQKITTHQQVTHWPTWLTHQSDPDLHAYKVGAKVKKYLDK